MNDFEQRVDLASARLGGRVIAANDDFFAEKENLVKDEAPIWIADKYTDRGKWMDGWESRRRRTPGHDWAIVQLGLPGVVRGVVVDTAFFKGNYPEACWIEGTVAAHDASEERLLSGGTAWTEILPRTLLQGDTRNAFAIATPWPAIRTTSCSAPSRAVGWTPNPFATRCSSSAATWTPRPPERIRSRHSRNGNSPSTIPSRPSTTRSAAASTS